MTFGVVPSSAETGYGYIKCGAALAAELYDLDGFVEKPDVATAQAYPTAAVTSGTAVCSCCAATYLEQLGEHAPRILSCCREAMATAATDLDFVRPEAVVFRRCPSDSIDYAVMEKRMSAPWWRWIVAGVTWAPGRRCGMASRDPNGNACKGDVISTTAPTAIFAAIRGCWRASGQPTWWSWKPPMRCWWPIAARCRTSNVSSIA